MRRTTLSLLCCVTLSLLLAACSQSGNKPADAPAATSTATPAAVPAQTTAASSEAAAPPAEVVQASASGVELKAGGATVATVRVRVADGYHINGNPASKFQIATTLDVETGEGITVGQVVYPPSIKKTFEFSKEPIVVYVGAAKGSRTLRGKLKVQPCDDKVCFPPRTLEVSLPVNVK